MKNLVLQEELMKDIRFVIAVVTIAQHAGTTLIIYRFRIGMHYKFIDNFGLIPTIMQHIFTIEYTISI